MKTYKASLSRLDRDYLEKSQKRAILPISVGQPYHEGEKFIATLKEVNKTFNSCTIAVCDTLQRHTRGVILNESDDKLLHKITRFDGDKWIERNLEVIDSILTIPYKIQRWDDWFKTDDYKRCRKKLDQFFEEDQEFQNLVQESAKEFSDKLKQYYDFDYKKSILGNVEYILEELSVLGFLYDKDYDFTVYPASHNKATDLALSQFKLINSPKIIKVNFKKLNTRDFLIDDIIDCIPGHVYYYNNDGTVLLCNKIQADALGRTKPSILGQKYTSFFKASIARTHREHDLNVINSQMNHICEEETMVNGKLQWVLSNKAPVIENGKVTGIVGVSVDISKQKQYEKELLKQTKTLQHALESSKVFLNNVNHEIRTPIHVICAISDALNEEKASLPEELRSYVDLLIDQNNRLKRYADNILELAKNAQYKESYNFKIYDLKDIISYVIGEMQILGKDINFEGIESKIKLDNVKIKSVITNLINNAVKYGDDQKVFITMKDDKDYVTVAVKNKGVIPEKEVSLIFEPFYQAEKTRTGAGGIGLGLSICKEIMIAHQGYIWAESKDGFVTVFFKLPK